MKFSLRGLLVFITLVAAATYVGLDLQLNSTSNCGGNNAALAQVRLIAQTVQLFALENKSSSYSVRAASAEQRAQLADLAASGWTGDASYFVLTDPIQFGVGGRRIVAFCDRPYSNVPRRVGGAPFSHAVAYSDGSTGLIGAPEFAKLNRDLYASLKELP